MAASIDIFVNNNLFEKDINYTIKKLADKLNIEIKLFRDISEYDNLLNNNEFWGIDLCGYESVEECFKKLGNIQIFRNNGMDEEEIWMSKSNVMLWGDKFDTAGEWYSFHSYIYGLENNYQYEQMIKDIIEYSKIFESNKLIIFSGNFHDDIQEKLWHGSSIEDIMLDKRWNIIIEPKKNNIEKEDINLIYYKEWELDKNIIINEWRKKFK